MPTSGQFKGIEDKVASCTENVQDVLASYPTSEAGRNVYFDIEGRYYKFYKKVFEEIRNSASEESRTFHGHALRLKLDGKLLSLVIFRAFRRMLYCKCFNAMDLNQMKQAGLYAYWLAKLKPIVIEAPTPDMTELSDEWENCLQEINERFAFHIIYSAFVNLNGKSMPIQHYQEKFVHAVRFRTFTEDSMMLLAESLGKEGFELAFNYKIGY
jgi:hypothetical protein